MRKDLLAVIGAVVLICFIATASVLAATSTGTGANTAGQPSATGQQLDANGMPGGSDGICKGMMGKDGQALTDEQKAQMEAARAQREEKVNAFVATLNDDQKALYDAMAPVKPADGQKQAKPDDAALAAMKEKQDAFVASLTDDQKTTYNELFAKRGGRGGFPQEMTAEQKAQMDAARAQREEKVNAFVATLNDDQKALYDAMTPVKPTDGQKPAKPDQAAMTAMKEKRDAFIQSLTDDQKAVYDGLFTKTKPVQSNVI